MAAWHSAPAALRALPVRSPLLPAHACRPASLLAPQAFFRDFAAAFSKLLELGEALRRGAKARLGTAVLIACWE